MNKQLQFADLKIKGVRPVQPLYRVESDVYKVRDYCKDSGAWDAFGLNPDDATDRADWFEYTVDLVRTSDGVAVDGWNSLFETWNGMQFLTKAECERAVAEIANDVRQGKVSAWFTLGKDFKL